MLTVTMCQTNIMASINQLAGASYFPDRSLSFMTHHRTKIN